MTKSQIIELIDSIEFTDVPVPSEYVNSDQAIDLEKFLKEIGLALNRIIVENSPPKNISKKASHQIRYSSKDNDTPTKTAVRCTDLESSVHIDADISDTTTFTQHLRQMTRSSPIQQVFDGNSGNAEILMSSDQFDTSSLHQDNLPTDCSD